MRVGKLTKEELSFCLLEIETVRSETIKGSALGEDCAVINLGKRSGYMIQDFCVYKNVLSLKEYFNTVYTKMRAKSIMPTSLLSTVIAHPNEKIDNIKKIIRALKFETKNLKVDLVGGHTEYSKSVNQTIVCFALFGKEMKTFKGNPDKLVPNEDYFLLTTDPITAPCNNRGFLSVNVNANDIAAGGGKPLSLCTMILTNDKVKDEQEINKNIEEIKKEAKKYDIKVTDCDIVESNALNNVITVTSVIGSSNRPILNSNAKVGDLIVVTKDIGLEGTAILEGYEGEKTSISDDEISVVKEAMLLVDNFPEVTTMHDITESGVFGATCEIALCSNMGAELYLERIPLRDITIKLAKKYKINPYKLISSGSLLYTISKEKADESIELLRKNNIKATVIGEMIDSGLYCINKQNRKINIDIEPDEIFKVEM